MFVASPTTSVSPTTTPAPQCPAGWLHCLRNTSKICIKVEWLCDGTVNCPLRWDEWPQNCPSETLDNFFGTFSVNENAVERSVWREESSEKKMSSQMGFEPTSIHRQVGCSND